MTAAGTTSSQARLTFRGLVAAEVLKSRGLRSSWWLIGLAVGLQVGIAVVSALVTPDAGSNDEALATALGAVADINYVPLLLYVMFGTLVATAEYERGAVMTTFAVVPRRTPVVLAKVVLVAVAVLVASLVAGLVAFLLAASVLGGGHSVSLGDPDVARILCGTAVFQAAAAVIALAVGLMIRSSVGSAAATLGFLYVVPALLLAVPVEAVGQFARTFPGPESSVLEVPSAAADLSTVLLSVLAVLAWTAVLVALACAVVRRRDV
jgi:ABC-2 type transport system permease protein